MKQERQETREDHKLPEHVARICIVGKARSGKDTACEILEQEFGFPFYMGSDQIKKYAHINNIFINSRQDSWDLAHFLIEEYGEDFYSKDLTQHFIEQYQNNPGIQGIVYAGSRLERPVLDLAQSLNFLLIEVTANDDLRYERSQERKKPGEFSDKERFLTHDEKEYEEISRMIQTLPEERVVQITNEGTLEDFQTNLISAISHHFDIRPYTQQFTSLSF